MELATPSVYGISPTVLKDTKAFNAPPIPARHQIGTFSFAYTFCGDVVLMENPVFSSILSEDVRITSYLQVIDLSCCQLTVKMAPTLLKCMERIRTLEQYYLAGNFSETFRPCGQQQEKQSFLLPFCQVWSNHPKLVYLAFDGWITQDDALYATLKLQKAIRVREQEVSGHFSREQEDVALALSSEVTSVFAPCENLSFTVDYAAGAADRERLVELQLMEKKIRDIIKHTESVERKQVAHSAQGIIGHHNVRITTTSSAEKRIKLAVQSLKSLEQEFRDMIVVRERESRQRCYAAFETK